MTDEIAPAAEHIECELDADATVSVESDPAAAAPRVIHPYAELHCVSNFTFLRGASHPAELVNRACELGYSALALTDECSMAGVVRAYEAAKKYSLKLIIGSEFRTIDDLHIVLLAPSQAAYAQICTLITKGRMGDGIDKGSYKLSRADFENDLDQCLALWIPSSPSLAVRGATAVQASSPSSALREASGCISAATLNVSLPSTSAGTWTCRPESPTGMCDDGVGEGASSPSPALRGRVGVGASAQALWLRNFFPGRSWIAVELHREAGDDLHLKTLRQLGVSVGIPLVAAGDVHMHQRERRSLQDTVTAIRHRCTLAEAGHRLFPNGERHLRHYEELTELYPHTLLDETMHIAERCDFSLGSLKYNYPNELVPEGMNATQHLRNLTETGLRKRWRDKVPDKARQAVEKELALIEHLKYEHFFLTVHEIVDWARSRPKPILCQGRGSAANSVVCYALHITEVNPELIEVLFERFLSVERNEPPDIDVDFEHERREEVIQHVFEKYGLQRAAIAATVVTYRPRSAIRDVGKALGLDTDIVDRLAKSQAYWDNWERFQETAAAQGLQLEAGIMQRLSALLQEIMNFPRHLSQHVGGFVISEEPISQLVPIENAAMDGRTIIQWDKNDLESLELLKVDVLALGMLTALQRTFDLLERAGCGPTHMDQIEREEKKTYDMICRADTVGVFQIESRAQMSMLPRLQPKEYYDLVIEIAIVRPGPIKGGMVHPYLQRRHMSPEDVPYPSEALRPVLSRTRGVPIFQEQVMQIAMVAAGFTAGEADELRRAMGAWNRNGKMGEYKQKLMEGMKKNNYSDEFANQIYKQIEGFGEYGFPESHSASFALLAYISSYLKCHHPAAFFAGLINSQPMGFYQPAQLLEQAKRQEVAVLPVDVCISEWDCTLEPDKLNRHAIRLGMRLVRGLRKSDAESIVLARQDARFISIEDVSHRASLPHRATKLLALCGAFRNLTENRNLAFWNALGTERLPGMLAGAAAMESQLNLPAPSEWEEVLRDYHQMRLSTGRHPLALLRQRLRNLGVSSRKELDSIESGQQVSVCGLVTHLQHPQTAKGVIFGSLEDETGINNIILWPGVFETYRHRILQTTLMMVSGELQSQDGVLHVVVQEVEDCSHWVRTLPRNSRDFH